MTPAPHDTGSHESVIQMIMRKLRVRPLVVLTGIVLLAASCSPGTPEAESIDTTASTPGVSAAGAELPPDTPVSNIPADSSSRSESGESTDAADNAPAASAPEPVAPQQAEKARAERSAQSPSLDAVIERATAAYEAARTARGTFTQVIVNSQTGSRVTSAGSFMRKQPDKFAFNFSDPDGDRIVADGRHVWLYLPSTNPEQVLRSTLTPSSAGSYDIGSLFFERTRERFEVTDGGRESLDGRTARVLRLTPRAAAPFTRATVWVDESSGNLRQFTVVDQMGLERTVRITSYTPNVPVPESAFIFEPPPGVRVVDTESLGR